MHEEVFLFSGQNTLWGGDVRPVVAQDRSTHRVSRGFDRYHDLFKLGISARGTIILRRFLTLVSSPQILPWFLVFRVSSPARALSLIGRSPFPKAIVSACTTIRAHRIAYSPLVFVTDILLVLLWSSPAHEPTITSTFWLVNFWLSVAQPVHKVFVLPRYLLSIICIFSAALSWASAQTSHVTSGATCIISLALLLRLASLLLYSLIQIVLLLEVVSFDFFFAHSKGLISVTFSNFIDRVSIGLFYRLLVFLSPATSYGTCMPS